MKKIIFALLLILTLLLAACNNEGAVSYTCQNNQDIPATASAAVQELNQRLLTACQTNDAASIENMATDLLRQEMDTETLAYLIETIGAGIAATENEHYVEFSHTGQHAIVVQPGLANEHPYFISLAPLSTQMYVIFSTITDGKMTYLLNTTYQLEEAGWQLATCYISGYKIDGLDIYQLIEKAKSLQAEDKPLPALLLAAAASGILNPGGIITYSDDATLKQDINAVVSATQPLFAELPSLQYGSSSLQLIGITIDIDNQHGLIPVISYITKSSLDNETTLQLEGAAIGREIDNLFTGMADNFSQLQIVAYQEMPIEQGKDYASYSHMVQIAD